MQSYFDFSRHSDVIAYEYGEEYIRIQFSNGDIYLYTYSSAGKHYIESMKSLADCGDGLSVFIKKYVKNLYERKEDIELR